MTKLAMIEPTAVRSDATPNTEPTASAFEEEVELPPIAAEDLGDAQAGEPRDRHPQGDDPPTAAPMQMSGEYAQEAGERERVGHGEDAADSPLDAVGERIAPLGFLHRGWIAKRYHADDDPDHAGRSACDPELARAARPPPGTCAPRPVEPALPRSSDLTRLASWVSCCPRARWAVCLAGR
jgi:hypothetical protein